jgi:hypothetical protein
MIRENLEDKALTVFRSHRYRRSAPEPDNDGRLPWGVTFHPSCRCRRQRVLEALA